jgi:hypothetical protein
MFVCRGGKIEKMNEKNSKGWGSESSMTIPHCGADGASSGVDDPAHDSDSAGFRVTSQRGF